MVMARLLPSQAAMLPLHLPLLLLSPSLLRLHHLLPRLLKPQELSLERVSSVAMAAVYAWSPAQLVDSQLRPKALTHLAAWVVSHLQLFPTVPNTNDSQGAMPYKLDSVV